MHVEDKKKKTRKVTDSSNKATSKSTVIIINEKPKRKRRNTKKKTETTQILQSIHVHQPYYFNPYEFHYPQAPQKVMEVNRQAALDTLDQNKSEEVKANLVSLGLIPPEGTPPFQQRMTAEPSTGASPLEIKNESNSTPKLNRRLSMNPLFGEGPLSGAFTVSKTPSVSSEGFKPLSESGVHGSNLYKAPNKLEEFNKKFDDIQSLANTPSKRTRYNRSLRDLTKKIVETFGSSGKYGEEKVYELVQKAETTRKTDYKKLEQEIKDFLNKTRYEDTLHGKPF